MERFKKQKETLEIILSVASAGAGLGVPIYFTRNMGNSVEDVMLKMTAYCFSMVVSLGLGKFIDDAFIRPHYKQKEFNEKYGIKKYMIPGPME